MKSLFLSELAASLEEGLYRGSGLNVRLIRGRTLQVFRQESPPYCFPAEPLVGMDLQQPIRR
jgi:hypothetical protein